MARSNVVRARSASPASARAWVSGAPAGSVPAAGVVGEAMVALVLAACYREKFGGDHVDDALGAFNAYRERIGWRR